MIKKDPHEILAASLATLEERARIKEELSKKVWKASEVQAIQRLLLEGGADLETAENLRLAMSTIETARKEGRFFDDLVRTWANVRAETPPGAWSISGAEIGLISALARSMDVAWRPLHNVQINAPASEVEVRRILDKGLDFGRAEGLARFTFEMNFAKLLPPWSPDFKEIPPPKKPWQDFSTSASQAIRYLAGLGRVSKETSLGFMSGPAAPQWFQGPFVPFQSPEGATVWLKVGDRYEDELRDIQRDRWACFSGAWAGVFAAFMSGPAEGPVSWPAWQPAFHWQPIYEPGSPQKWDRLAYIRENQAGLASVRELMKAASRASAVSVLNRAGLPG